MVSNSWSLMDQHDLVHYLLAYPGDMGPTKHGDTNKDIDTDTNMAGHFL